MAILVLTVALVSLLTVWATGIGDGALSWIEYPRIGLTALTTVQRRFIIAWWATRSRIEEY